MTIPSLAEIPESELLRTLHGNTMCRAWLLPPGYQKSYYPFFDVPLPSLFERMPPQRGDIDLLIVPSGNPEEGLAYQFKRVKVTETTYFTERPNKLREIRKLAKQANLLAAIGFHEVRATILVLVDSRLIGGPNPWLKFAPPAVAEAVVGEVAKAGFDPAVSVTTIEICQPIDKDFRLAGSGSVRTLQSGAPSPQAPEVTAALLKMVASAP